MSQYEFTARSFCFNSKGEEVKVTYSFDVDEDGAELYSAVLEGSDVDIFGIVTEEERESLAIECLERMAGDRRDAAIYKAEAAEADREWESNYER